VVLGAGMDTVPKRKIRWPLPGIEPNGPAKIDCPVEYKSGLILRNPKLQEDNAECL
jgi:hypothetical protein